MLLYAYASPSLFQGAPLTARQTDVAAGTEEVPKFASRALVFLLQHRPNTGANSAAAGGDDVNVAFER